MSVWLLCAVSVSAQEIFSLPSEDRRLNPEFEVVYRVGSLSGEDWEQFGRVRKVAFNDAGQLYIFDTQADRITARSGCRIRRVGLSSPWWKPRRRPTPCRAAIPSQLRFVRAREPRVL